MQKVVIFYSYVFIEYPQRILKWQSRLCQYLHLKGRVVIAHEGINATLQGSTEAIARYRQFMDQHGLFKNIDYKETDVEGDCFVKLDIKVKNEIVHLGVDPDIIHAKNSGTHLAPEQVHALLSEQPDNLIVFDARNNYESAIGHFRNAVTPDINHFRELPGYIDNTLDQFKDKQVLMYCTAGVRCERASAYLKSKNVARAVYQMKGGIQRYVEQYPDGHFRGKNYVFDARISVQITSDVIGHCFLCNASCNEYTNCLYATCNRHFIACASCVAEYQSYCSTTCKQTVFAHNGQQRPPLHKIQSQPS
jgi:predicted sulfurtransferase